ncbi:hypothetical protein AMK12_37405 [Streptomyces sp. TSRI0395]|nr:hypothetical protein AMK12_37405 [Streptomyces sp. TSRI0395]
MSTGPTEALDVSPLTAHELVSASRELRPAFTLSLRMNPEHGLTKADLVWSGGRAAPAKLTSQRPQSEHGILEQASVSRKLAMGAPLLRTLS